MSRKLYTTPFCGYCDRVRSELERLDLAFEEVPVGSREVIFRLSGQWRVPVLDDGGEVIPDSSRILEYLKRKYTSDDPRRA